MFLAHFSNTSIEYWLDQPVGQCVYWYNEAVGQHNYLNRSDE